MALRIPEEAAGRTLVRTERLIVGPTPAGIQLAEFGGADDTGARVVVSPGTINTWTEGDNRNGAYEAGGNFTSIVEYSDFPGSKPYTVVSSIHDVTADSVVGDSVTTEVSTSRSGAGFWTVPLKVPTGVAGHNMAVVHKVYAGSDTSVPPVVETPQPASDRFNFTVDGIRFSGHIDTSDQKSIGATVTDRVHYDGLNPGETYTISALLHDYEDGSAVGEQSVVTFTAAADGEGGVNVPIRIPNDAAGKKLVAYLTLYAGAEASGTPIASDEDPDNVGQTFTVDPLALVTDAIDKRDGDHEVMAGDTVMDRVTYSFLEPGATYTLQGTLMYFTDVTPVTEPVSMVVTASATGSGEWIMELPVPRDAKQNASVVVYQKLFEGDGVSGDPIVAEANPNQSRQTVKIVGVKPAVTTTVTVPETTVKTSQSPSVTYKTSVVTSNPLVTSDVTSVNTSIVPVTRTSTNVVTSMSTVVTPITRTITSMVTIPSTVGTSTVMVTSPTTLTETTRVTSTTPITSTVTQTFTSTASTTAKPAPGSSDGTGSSGSSGLGALTGIGVLGLAVGGLAAVLGVFAQPALLPQWLLAVLPMPLRALIGA